MSVLKLDLRKAGEFKGLMERLRRLLRLGDGGWTSVSFGTEEEEGALFLGRPMEVQGGAIIKGG